jgi:hypothetical protein
MSSIEGYGGRAGNHQYAFAHCIKGIESADVEKRIAERQANEEDEEECD